MLLIRAGPLRVKPDPAAAVWVSRAGWLRSGTFPWYRDSPVHIRDFPLSVGGPWAQSESRPRVCPEQTPAFFGGGWDGRSPAGEGPRLHAGLLEGSPRAPVRVCDPMCEHRAGLCFQMCLCAFVYTRVHGHSWLRARVCFQVCIGARACARVCNRGLMGDSDTPRRGWKGSNAPQKNSPGACAQAHLASAKPPKEMRRSRAGRGITRT